MSDINNLIQGYLDNRLTDDDVRVLQAWIKADEGNTRTFIRYCLVHSHLRTLCLEADLHESLAFMEMGETPASGVDAHRSVMEPILGATEQEPPEKVRRIRELADRELGAFLEEQEQLRRAAQLEEWNRIRHGTSDVAVRGLHWAASGPLS